VWSRRRRSVTFRALLRLVRRVHRDVGRGRVAFVTLAARPTTRFDPDDLRARDHAPVRSSSLLNSPPQTRPERFLLLRAPSSRIGRRARAGNTICSSSPTRVYEHLVYDGGARPRSRPCPACGESQPSPSVRAAKSFSFTGWKVGWVCAPPRSSSPRQDGQAVS